MKKDNMLKGTGRMLLQALYPPACPVCGALTGNRLQLCGDCKKRMRPVQEPLCMRCGKPLGDPAQEFCEGCAGKEGYLDRGAGVFPYHSAAKKIVMDLKFHGRKENAVLLGGYMAAFVRPYLPAWQPQVLIPVPLHGKKQRIRGYNQAELLARTVSEQLHIPLRTDLVHRINPTKALKKQGKLERQRSLSGAFAADRMAGRYSSVLLIDDIYTTGSTADAVACALKSRGVKKVCILCACIGADC